MGSRGSEWTFLTNAGAPRYRVVRTDISAAAPAWTNVVPQHEADLLQWVRLLGGGKLVCSYLRNVQVIGLWERGNRYCEGGNGLTALYKESDPLMPVQGNPCSLA